MADTLTVAPETAQVPAPPAPPEPAAPAAPPAEPAPPQSPQQTSRADLYRRYYDTPAPPAPAGEPEPPASEPTAQVAPPAEPVVAPPAVPDPALVALQTELAELKARLAPPPPAQVQPAPGSEVWLTDWLTLAREGKMKEAQDMLIAKTKEQILPDTIAPAVARSREIAKAEADVERFVNDLRVANPELLDLEDYITFQAERRLADLRNQGKINTTGEFVTQYKLAVNASAEDARKLYARIRGQGKQEAQTRTREVMASSTLPPTGTTEAGLRPSLAAPAAPAPETTEDYFAKRRALESKGRGLG